MANKLAEAFIKMSLEARELYLDSKVPVLENVPTPLEFYRDWVSPNKPVLIRNAIDHWPALSHWDIPYLRRKIGEQEVTITITPNGYADAVCDDKFIMPRERLMKMNDFLDIIDGTTIKNGVYYIQKQNSNLTDEFVTLLEDTDKDISWATEALGRSPDAVNFWMGEKDAVTSMHKDHYENIYCVVRGWKQFILIPPSDQTFVPYGMYKPARYHMDEDGGYSVIDDESDLKVPWIPVDPENPDLKKYPQYSRAQPVVVTVHQGESLYLPSLWFHHVRQSHGCIAVNYWYDMEYDVKYNYYKFCESLLHPEFTENEDGIS